MADKPLYYGNSKSSPMYYGASSGTSSRPGYGGKSPMYYGAKQQYGTYGQYGAYGGTYGGGQGGDDGSVVGTITIARILRVISQRWLSVFVFILVGLIVAFAVYRISPPRFVVTSHERT